MGVRMKIRSTIDRRNPVNEIWDQGIFDGLVWDIPQTHDFCLRGVIEKIKRDEWNNWLREVSSECRSPK